jgi:hypothetical protein
MTWTGSSSCSAAVTVNRSSARQGTSHPQMTGCSRPAEPTPGLTSINVVRPRQMRCHDPSTRGSTWVQRHSPLAPSFTGRQGGHWGNPGQTGLAICRPE